jgi:hypothetical protein
MQEATSTATSRAAWTAVPLYTATLVLSAFLLFSVQPLLSKMILPLLGGSASVWNTAMVFFQAALLAGYFYAHATSRYLPIRAQAALHLAVLAACVIFLPAAVPHGTTPTGSPALWQLGFMTALIGAPFFAVSASAPMLQRWFSKLNHPDAANPYFLYAASNIGSMAALLSYPFIIEPLLTVRMQNVFWTAGYVLLVALTAACGLVALRTTTQTAAEQTTTTAHVPLARRLEWLALAFIPSSLMLGVTTFVTTDIASAPLFWIAPLTLYLVTFILVFARRQYLSLPQISALFVISVVVLLFKTSSGLLQRNFVVDIPLHFCVFFFACLLCHKLLADRRPDATHLTSFYMYMSLGGVLGGAFNALAAPVLFVVPIEYALVLCLALFVNGYSRQERTGWGFRTAAVYASLAAPAAVMIWMTAEHEGGLLGWVAGVCVAAAAVALIPRPMAFAAYAAAVLLALSPLSWLFKDENLAVERNFFGVLRVVDDRDQRRFYHGTEIHGAQPRAPDLRLVPITYYHPLGGAGDVFDILNGKAGDQRIAVIGLGAGSLACYARPGRVFDFYEIDIQVKEIAENRSLFTYLSDCGSPYNVVIGDGRLKISEATESSYDAVILDAFSSDNIPMHLLTHEAFATYRAKLKEDGLLAVHLTNRNLDFKPNIAALAAAMATPAFIRDSHGGPVVPDGTLRYSGTTYAVLTRDPAAAAMFREKGWKAVQPGDAAAAWSDNFGNIVAALKILQPERLRSYGLCFALFGCKLDAAPS